VVFSQNPLANVYMLWYMVFMKTIKCKDCDFCHVVLPIEPGGKILYSAPEGMPLECSRGFWKDKNNKQKLLKPYSLSEVNKILEGKKYTSSHWNCSKSS
jgi:hypothetical protein